MRSILSRSALGIYVTCTGLILVCYAVFRKDFVSLFWSLFFLGLIVLILIAHAVHHLCVHAHISKYKIDIPRIAELNEGITISMNSIPKTFFSPFFYQIEFVAHFPSRPKQSLSIPLEKTDIPQQIRWQIPWRGYYQVQVYLGAWDIFGFFYERILIPAHRTLILPPAVPSKNLHLISRIQENINGLAHGKAYACSPEAADTREYYPGDDPRRINWKQSVRFQKLFIRQEDPHQRMLHHVRFILFPPPMTQQGADLLDPLIHVMLQLIFSYSPEEVETSIVIGSRLIENFNISSISDRGQLSICHAGMVYESDKHFFQYDGPLVFLGCASDPLLLEALRKYHHQSPLLFVTDSPQHDQIIKNVIFLAKSLKMDVYDV